MTWLQEDVTRIALCWRIARRDGVTIGLTGHDRDLTIDGLTYRAAPGMTPSAIRQDCSLDGDSMEVTGALSAAAITERDLLAGRWDGARVSVFAVDWGDVGDVVSLGSGTIGAVELEGEALTAELRGTAAALERPVAEATTPGCRAELGDKRCRVAMAARTRFARVVAVEGETVTLDIGEPVAGAWGGGRLRWMTGGNSGLEDAIAAAAGPVVTLRRPPRFAGVGTLVEVREGCDKRIETCATRFANAANFRGEPYLPGVDLLTRYPGAG